jgi:phosphohistidine phosphatase
LILYLVRHGDAVTAEENSLRPLSEKGRRDVRKVAEFAAGREAEVTLIFHSGKLRAEQTAKIISERLNPDRTVIVTDGLSPMDDPHDWHQRISAMRDDTMLVGHLPHIGSLLSLLLKHDMGENVFEFQAGGVACVRRSKDGKWSLEWVVNPGDIA